MEFFFKYGLLGVICRLLFILSLLFVGAWILWQLVVAVWPWLLGLAVAGGIYLLVRRQSKA